MVNGTAAVLEPTFTGYVATTHDALILFEACLTGVLHHVPRRPHDRERSHLVRSGSVFIYEEDSSGIKRWTDGVTWSPSRILGNFLVYRELEKPFPPGEKKRAMKKANRRPLPPSRPGEPYPRQDPYSPTAATTPGGSSTGVGMSAAAAAGAGAGPGADRPPPSEVERALVGSLVDSYGFKDSGLVKKTMSVTVSGVTHHLVSYYSVEDVIRGALSPPSLNDSLRYIRPRPELTQKQSFRAPIDDLETTTLDGTTAAALTGVTHGGPDAASAHTLYSSYRQPMMGGASAAAAAAAAMGYPVPTASPDFYLSAAGAYASHPLAVGPNPYLSAGATPKADEYGGYRPSAYGSSFDSLPTTALSASMTSGSMAGSFSERHRSHSDHSQSAYRNSSISSRSVATDVTSPIDPSPPAHYSRGSFSMPGPLDTTTPVTATAPSASSSGLDSRRDSHPIPAAYYTGPERSAYYVGPAGASNYPGAQPLTTWTTTAAQPQI
ncbi:hypothetical protein ASPZODRAFT_135774 [Penicilliopsis zonata CBS 506.65]|uniref:Camp independent regulatory protein n=1 Tax=Penicilliopsis zonata CBS 506.65 TaxID=1073090 RepID=A0A1L9S9A6_9EURO|nr:hypothetical protein ASPZODRAFT_135774 [Penicilliopsis zonata CBS 506.65]OJJ43751.1 hypothetical protein ASPZODRAFT_135774 [Penicilliopsis zonata CBS 506.65]